MPLIPSPGAPPGWADDLDAFLRAEHNDDGSLRKLTRRREPWRKANIRNDVSNPRGVGRVNWTQSQGSVTGLAFTDLDDADFAFGVDYGANGHCVRATGSLSVPGASQSIYPAFTGTTGTVVTISGAITFFRMKVKVVTCPADSEVTLESVFDHFSDGSGRAYRIIASQWPVNSGDIFYIEGFAPATNDRAHARVQLFNPGGSTGAFDLRVGQAQIVVEPEGDVPEYGDGYRIGWSWDGAADASASHGPVWPLAHDPDTFRGGHNSFQLFHADSPLTAEQICAHSEELGSTHMRMSIGGGPMGIDGVWPSGQADPDWDAPGTNVAKMVAACRKFGLKYMPIVGAVPTWMTTNGGNSQGELDPAHAADAARIITSLLEYAPDVIDSLEVYNEVNLVGVEPTLWNNPALYVSTMLTPIHDAAKSVNPDVKIIGGCFARVTTTDPTSGTSILDYLRGMYAAGAKGKMDAISVHPYTDDLSTADPSASGAFHSGFDQCMRQTRQARHENTDDATPIWITEYGWPTGSGGTERSQMQYMTLLRGILGRSPDVEAAFFHTLTATHDIPAGWQQTFPFLLLDTERRRAVYHAFRRRGVSSGADWERITLANSWVASASNNAWSPFYPTAGVGVRKDENSNHVELRGLVGKTTGAISDYFCDLPEGYAPAHDISRAVTVYNGATTQLGTLYIFGRVSATPGRVVMQFGGSIAAGSLCFLHANWLVEG